MSLHWNETCHLHDHSIALFHRAYCLITTSGNWWMMLNRHEKRLLNEPCNKDTYDYVGLLLKSSRLLGVRGFSQTSQTRISIVRNLQTPKYPMIESIAEGNENEKDIADMADSKEKQSETRRTTLLPFLVWIVIAIHIASHHILCSRLANRVDFVGTLTAFSRYRQHTGGNVGMKFPAMGGTAQTHQTMSCVSPACIPIVIEPQNWSLWDEIHHLDIQDLLE